MPFLLEASRFFCHVFSRSHFVKHVLCLCALVFSSGGEMAKVLAPGASLGKFPTGYHSPSFCKPFSNLSALADCNGPQIIIKATQPLPREMEELSVWQDICSKLVLAYRLRVHKLVPWGGCLVSCHAECLSFDVGGVLRWPLVLSPYVSVWHSVLFYTSAVQYHYFVINF